MKSKLGYKRNSPDKNRPFNIIPSGRITMKEDNGTPLKKGPILGIDNLGNYEMMYPGMEYQFPGNEVFEIPMAQLGAENRKESGQKDLSYKWSEPMSKRSLPISYTKVQKGGWLENLPKAQKGNFSFRPTGYIEPYPTWSGDTGIGGDIGANLDFGNINFDLVNRFNIESDPEFSSYISPALNANIPFNKGRGNVNFSVGQMYNNPNITTGLTYKFANGGSLKKAQVGLEQNVRGKRKGDPVRDWWYNLEDVQSTYDMYPQKDSFLSDWILNPITQQKLKENLSRSVITRDINPIGLSAQAVANLRNTPVFSRELVKKTGISQSDIDYNNRLQGWQSPNTFYSNPYFSGYNSLTGTQNSGVYYPDYKQIIVNTFDDPGVLVHEGVHATGPFQEAMEDVIDYSFRDKRNPERGFIRRYGTSELNEKTGKFEYPPFEEVVKKYPLFYKEFLNEKKYLDDDGMYPRIMDIRKTLNLKPGQKVDKSILFKDEIFSPVHDLRLYYDDDTIIEILNTIAKTEKKAEELEPKAQKGGTNRTVKWLDKLQEGEEVPTIGPIDLPAIEISDKADPRALINQGSFFGDTNNRYTTQFKETGVPQIFTDYAVAEMAKERQAAEPQLPMTLEEYQKQMGTIRLPSTDISAPFVDPNTGEVDYGKMAFAGLEGIASGFVGASTPKVPKAAVNYLQPTKLVLPPGFNPYTLGKSNKQITSTLTGSNLEKQLSKTGEINRNVILTHIGKRDTPSSDKTIIQRVLDEDFPNQSKIDYREFKKAIDNKIVSLNKDVLVDQYSNYGIQNLGYSGVSRRSYEQALKNQEMGINALTDDIAKMQKDPNYKSSTWPHYKLEDIQKLLAETIETYNKTKADLESVPESKTIKFSNKQEFGTGDAKHFPDDPYALGHSRYFINPKQPNIFNLLEVQSDFSQGSGSVLKKNLRREDYTQRKEKRISSLENDVANWEKALKHMKETGTDYFGMKAYSWNIKDIEEHINYSKKRLEDAKADFKNAEQKVLFTDSYFDRQLQETVQYAAENGQNIVRVPTKETATKIQGYKPISEPVKPEQAEKLKKAIADQKEMVKNKRNPDGTSMDKSDIAHYEMNIQGLEEELNMTLKYDQKHETILKKYTEQPKIIKKLFGAEPRTVTDDKGNTWYEFDIPKSYLEGKGEIKAYKLGGQKGGWLDKLQTGKEVKKKIPQGNLVKPGEDFVDISAGKKPWQRIFAEENADISRPLILGEVPIFASGVTLPNYGDLSQDEIAALQDKGPVGTAAAMKASGRYKDKGSYGESVKNFSAFPITASSQMLQIPQSAMVEGIEALRGRPYSFQNALPFSGKQRVPSETFGITNPYLGFAADVLMDPENLIPSAFAKNLMENVTKQGLRKGISTTGKNIFSGVPNMASQSTLDVKQIPQRLGELSSTVKALINQYKKDPKKLITIDKKNYLQYDPNKKGLFKYDINKIVDTDTYNEAIDKYGITPRPDIYNVSEPNVDKAELLKKQKEYHDEAKEFYDAWVTKDPVKANQISTEVINTSNEIKRLDDIIQNTPNISIDEINNIRSQINDLENKIRGYEDEMYNLLQDDVREKVSNVIKDATGNMEDPMIRPSTMWNPTGSMLPQKDRLKLIYPLEQDAAYNSLSQKNKKYIEDNLGQIAGFRSNDATVTYGNLPNRTNYLKYDTNFNPLRLKSWFRPYSKSAIPKAGVRSITLNPDKWVSPINVGKTAAHELGHDLQSMLSSSILDTPWGRFIAQENPNYGYYTSTDVNNPVARRFANALVPPVPVKPGESYPHQNWLSSGNELHSDIMGERFKIFKDLRNQGYSLDAAIALMKNNEDATINQMLDSGNLDDFFKSSTPRSERFDLIKKYMPAVAGFGTFGYLGLQGLNQNNQAEYQKGGQKRLKKQKSGWLDNLNN